MARALRTMTAEDVDAVVAVQEPAAVVGLADVFDQATHPFPRERVAERWHVEVADPDITCLVVQDDGVVAGFVAVRGAELLHFGTALESWGTGLATWAHDATLARMADAGLTRAWLRVFADNHRGRRFYEKLGWRPTEESSHSGFPPYPELLTYERRL